MTMCLGVPGRITDRWQQADGALLAHADFAGEVRVIRLNYQPDLQVGDWTIVHAGFALTRLDEVEAGRTLALLRDVGLLEPAAEERADPAPAQHVTT